MPKSNHIFISYSHRDSEWVSRLITDLRKAGHNVWVDRVSIRGGEEWKIALRRGIAESDAMLVCCSTEAISSEYVASEIEWARDEGVQIIPLVLEEGTLPKALSAIQYIDFSASQYTAALSKLLQSLPRPKDIDRIPFLVDHPRLDHFEGRDPDLENLHRLLTDEQSPVGIAPAVITGMGGIGKTQLAVEYAWRYRYFYPGGVLFVNAAEDWSTEFARIGTRLQLIPADPSDPDRIAQLVAAVEQYFKHNGDALIILDNVDNPAEVITRPIGLGVRVPSFGAKLLFTTRRRDLPEGMLGHRLGLLDKTSSVQVVARIRPSADDGNAVEDLCAVLGYLPKALDIAVAFLRSNPTVTVSAYVAELRRRGAPPTSSPASPSDNLSAYYARTLTPALDAQWANLTTTAAPELLELASTFGEASHLPLARLGLLAELPDDPFGVAHALDSLVQDLDNAALIERLTDETVRVHPLIRDYVWQRYGHQEMEATLTRAAERLSSRLRNPITLAAQVQQRGIDEILDDLREVSTALLPANAPESLLEFQQMLEWEGHRLRKRNPQADATSSTVLWQQLRERSHHEGNAQLCAAFDTALSSTSFPFFRSLFWSQYPNDQQLIRILSAHSQRVTAVAAASETQVVSGSDDRTIRLWDLQRGTVLQGLEGHAGGIAALLILTERMLLSGSADHTIRLWNLDTGEQVRVFRGHQDGVTALVMLSDHRFASGSSDGSIRIWDSASGQTERALRAHASAISSLTTVLDRYIASGSHDSTVSMWDIQSGQFVKSVGEFSGAVTCLAATNQGQLLAGTLDGTLSLWDPNRRSPIVVLKGHSAPVTGAILLDSTRAISASADRTLRLWDLTTGNTLHIFHGHTQGITNVVRVGIDRLVSASGDKTLGVWSSHLAHLHSSEPRDVHQARVSGVAWMSAERAVSASFDHTLRLWNTVLGKPIRVLSGHQGEIQAIARADDNHVVSASSDRTVRLWNVQNGDQVGICQGHEGAVNSIAMLGSDRVASGSNDCTVRVWNVKVSQQQHVLRGHRSAVHCIAAVDDQLVLSGSADRTVRLWDIATQTSLAVFEGHEDTITVVASLPGHRYVSGSADATIHLWDAHSQTSHQVLRGHTQAITALCVLTADWILSAADDRTIRLWSVRLNKSIAVLELDSVPVCLSCHQNRILVGDSVGRLHALEVVGDSAV